MKKGKLINFGKRLLTSVLFLAMLATTLLVVSNQVVYASSTTDKTGASRWTPQNEVTTNLEGMTHINASGITTTSGSNSNQHISVFKMKTDGVTSKLVTWAVQNDNKNYVLSTLTDIAEDYEKTHPGWEVLGGINGDQYYFLHGLNRGENGSAIYMPQPYYPLIMDGESRFGATVYNVTASNYVGFKNDGSSNPLALPCAVVGFVLTIYDENHQVLDEIAVDNVNKSPEGNQLTVWYPVEDSINYGKTITRDVNSVNDIYIVGNADLAYASNSTEYQYIGGNGIDAFFGKGEVSSVAKTAKLGSGQFAIETTNTQITEKISVGTYIMVDYKYQDEAMNQVDASSGYHSIHIYNGEEQNVTGSYNTRQYSRSLFGSTSNGEYILITADLFSGDTSQGIPAYKGLNNTECNAVLKHYGANYAFQGDGGGSVTAILRNQEGGFDVVNYPQYGTQRTNLTGLLFVTRKAGVVENSEQTTRNSVTLSLLQPALTDSTIVENVKISNGSQNYSFTNNICQIDNLTEDTEYTFNITYDVLDKETNTRKTGCKDTITIKTKAFEMPECPYAVKEINKTSITFEKKETEFSSWFTDAQIMIGDYAYQMGSLSEYTAENLIYGTTYSITYQYTIVEPATGNSYYGTYNAETVTTKEYELPKINVFTLVDDKLKISYEYEDEDKVVTRAYILYGTENDLKEKELRSKRGSSEFSDLNKGEDTYIFKLVLETSFTKKDGTVEEKTIISDEITVLKETTEETKKKGCKKSSAEYLIASISTISLMAFILRKKK